MAKYIDAGKFERVIMFSADPDIDNDAAYAVISLLNMQPTADVEPVKRGKWINDDSGVIVCSECGEEHEWQDYRASYCDTCGAKMEGETE